MTGVLGAISAIKIFELQSPSRMACACVTNLGWYCICIGITRLTTGHWIFLRRVIAAYVVQAAFDCATPKPGWLGGVMFFAVLFFPWDDFFRKLRKKLAALRASMTAVAQHAFRRQVGEAFGLSPRQSS